MSIENNGTVVQYEMMRYTLRGDYLKEISRHPGLSDPQADFVDLWYNRLREFKRTRRRL